jgi:hypothetical protein
MKKICSILTGLWIILMLTGCGNNKSVGESSNARPQLSSDTSKAETTDKKVGDWVKKGEECYGIVIVNLTDGKTIGKSVKCKIMSVKPEKVKMKTIEKVSLMEAKGCDKIGLSYGDTWWETEGDIFKTREDADKYLLEKGWFIQ